MARLRTIKPGFFLNDELAEIDPLGRLLFAGLWCIADREGRLEDRPRKIKAEILPYDDADVDTLLDALASRGFIQRYTVQDEQYIAIINFGKHQNPHIKEGASSIPAPCKNSARTVQAPEEHDVSNHTSTPMSGIGDLDHGIQEQRIYVADSTEPLADVAHPTHPTLLPVGAADAAADVAPVPHQEINQETQVVAGKSGRATRSKRLFGRDSPPYLLAQRLEEAIRSFKPDANIPTDLQGWCVPLDAALRLNGRSYERLCELIDWLPTNEFWRKNILSAGTLRDKLDRLELQMDEDKQKVMAFNGSNGRAAATGTKSYRATGRGTRQDREPPGRDYWAARKAAKTAAAGG